MPMKKLNIKLLGKEAGRLIGIFPNDNENLIENHKEITCEDDIIFCLSYPLIIPEKYLLKPRVGVFVNHSSDLPKGRGWAPLQWSVLKKLDKVTITLFKASKDMDMGDWCFKEHYPIENYDTIYDLYNKDRALTRKMLKNLVSAYKSGNLIFHKQKGSPEYWPKRTPGDSLLDPSLSLIELWDSIRICDNNDYPAFFLSENSKIIVRHNVIHPIENDNKSSEIELPVEQPLSKVWNNMICKKYQEKAFYFVIGDRKVYLNFEICYDKT